MRTMILDCTLTDEEKIERGEALSTMVQDLKALEEEKKAVGTEFKERIDNKAFEARYLAKVIKQGYEERVVEVVEVDEVKDHKMRVVQIFRTDTGAMVSSRSMAIEDAQEEMFNDNRHDGKITLLGGGKHN